MPFPGATGEGLKIAVIDSGVNMSHPHIISKTSNVVLAGDASADELGHGTAVMAAIQEKAPAAEYFALKLFGNSLTAASSLMLQALEWSIENGMNLVNLSLGTSNYGVRPALESLLRRAGMAGVIVVSARYANRRPVLPGILQGVVSVDVDWQLNRHCFAQAGNHSSPYFLASGYPRPLPGMPLTKNLSGISFAVANMTGLIARACPRSGFQSLGELERLLSTASA